MKKTTLYIILFMIPFFVKSQETGDPSNSKEERIRRNNVVLTIGHALVPNAEDIGKKNMTLIPTWGLSYEYRFSNWFLLGLKGEIEVSNYVIEDNEGTLLTREYPISLILYGDFRIVKDLYIYAGPGIEFEKEENFFIAALGLFYEVEFGKGWALIPEISYKLKGTHTGAYAIGLGVNKEF